MAAVHQKERPGPKAWVRALDSFLLKATGAMALAGMACLVLAIVVVVGDIVWRRVGGGSFIGAIDLTQFSVMAAVSWSLPYVFATGKNVSVDLLNAYFGARAMNWLDSSAYVLGALLLGFLCWLSAKRGLEIWDYGDVSQDLAIPMIWFWAFLVSGLWTATVVCLVRAARLAISPNKEI